MKQLLIVINVFLFLILCVEIIAIAKALTVTQQAKSYTTNTTNKAIQNNPTPIPKSQNSSLEPPELPTQLDWKIANTTGPNSLYQDVKDSMLSYNIDTPISIPGKEWVAVAEQQETFGTEYDTQLTKDGWSQNNKYNGHTLSAIAADGPTGSIWGYSKIVNGNLRAIIISKSSISRATGKVTTDCPCNYEYRIFVSDIIPTNTFQTKK